MRRRRADVHFAKMRGVGMHGLYDAVHGRRERMFDRGRLYKPSCKSRREKSFREKIRQEKRSCKRKGKIRIQQR